MIEHWPLLVDLMFHLYLISDIYYLIFGVLYSQSVRADKKSVAARKRSHKTGHSLEKDNKKKAA